MRDGFSACHPVINFTFFAGALVCGMFLMHPYYLACSIFLSFSYYLTVRKKEGIPFLIRMIVLFAMLSVLNPFFNSNGNTVLFTYLNQRPYTLESLLYGMALAAMMISVLTWFASYHSVMTSDKFMYLLGHVFPAVTITLTMILRLIPAFQKKVCQINHARKCIGMSADSGTRKEKAQHGLVIVSALTSWALEGSITTAESMQSRGYGCGKRTHYSLYRLKWRDRIMLISMIFFLGIVVFCVIHGGANVSFSPDFSAAGTNNPWYAAGISAYGAFLFMPTAVNIVEEIRCHSLKSKI